MKRVAVVNKTTNEVENIIVVDNVPNHEEEEHYYVSIDREIKRIRNGWKYDKEKMEFSTDNPELEDQSYTAEEMLNMEELAWEKMLNFVKGQNKKPKKSVDVKKPKKKT